MKKIDGEDILISDHKSEDEEVELFLEKHVLTEVASVSIEVCDLL